MSESIRHLKSTLLQYARSYGIILLINFVELSLGFLVIGINNAIVMAACIALFDILPIVGCGTILLPWVAIDLIGGRTTRGISLLVLYIIIFVVRNATEPKIVGNRVGMHPLLTLVSMILGVYLFGAIGLFALPVALVIMIKLNEDGVISLYK